MLRITQYPVLLLLLLLPTIALCDVKCGGVVCSSLQTCCNDQVSCCMKSTSTSSLIAVVGVISVVCLTATGLGICLYFKKRVHRDTAYSPDDIEDMYVKSLYKEMKSKVEPTPSNQTVASRNGLMTSRNGLMTSRDNLTSGGTPGLICEDIPTINPGNQHTELSAMPSSYSIPGSVATSRDNVMMISRDNLMTSRQNSSGTLNSVERVAMMDKMTESVETQVTSAKRTVVTVNLNMKEKENIKLNIFMNKDHSAAVTEEVESNASFPQGLTAKLARKKSAKRSSSSSADQKASVSNKDSLRRNSSVDRKASVNKKDSLRRNSSKSPRRPKTPVKEKLSKRPSSAKKKKK